MNSKNINRAEKALLMEALEKVNGGMGFPDTDNEDTVHLSLFTPTDGINDNGVYIGVNVPSLPSDKWSPSLIGACLNHG